MPSVVAYEPASLVSARLARANHQSCHHRCHHGKRTQRPYPRSVAVDVGTLAVASPRTCSEAIIPPIVTGVAGSFPGSGSLLRRAQSTLYDQVWASCVLRLQLFCVPIVPSDPCCGG
jgi:hypothetical protein